MKLTKRQKTGLVVLAIGLLALVVDRAFLGGGGVPAGASASSNEAPAEPVPEAASPPDPNSEPPTIRLAQRLETLWSERNPDMNQPRDIFSLPVPWLADVRPSEVPPATPVDRPSPEPDAVTAFTANHQLRGVVKTDQGGCVTVDDHLLKVGEELDGFILVAIEEESATFEAGGRQVSLMLVSDR